MKPRILDLFAGCGGFSQGFMQAGCEVIAFVEQWQPAVATFQQNHPSAQLIGTDITKIKNDDLLKYYKKIDIIIGGPPCQGFSLCGNRDPKDKRNQLYKHFLRFVEVIEPIYVVLENVHGLLTMRDTDGEKIIHKIVERFIENDYSVTYKILDAANYGVPQHRKRLFIIARKMKWFSSEHLSKKTVADALDDLTNQENVLNGHEFFTPTQETIQKIRNLKQGERMSLKFNTSRQRLFADKPSRTILTKPIYIHPFYNRFLTARELARLQSFPDNFLFCGSKIDKVKQIGNAVPPLLAKKIAESLRCTP
ncbi:DNA cytosine methyltransferase [Candidatus Woesearchaeota archaeon]|nr:DNA cytosine methyltransferase [Candidatus Woesearchaeota archaeon]